MNLRSRLTYANVVGTLALCLAIGGGTVYAASELGRNDVKSKNIAKGAVKTSDLATDAVTSEKLKDGTVTGADLQDGAITAGDIQDGTITAEDIVAGVIPQLDADVTGSATAGPQGGINANTTTPLPLSGTTSFTPNAGEVAAIAAEAQFAIATTNALNPCSPDVQLLLDGQEANIFLNPDTGQTSTTPVQAFGHDADGPFGLLKPGTPINITAQILGDVDCTAGSTVDKVEVSIVQIR
jgi:hypothetical protein